MNEEPFFIIGTQRGGTTLLRLMLNKHSNICIPPESHFLISLFKKFAPQQVLNKEQQYVAKEIISSHPRFSTWNVSLAEFDGIIDLLPEQCPLPLLIKKLFEKQIEPTGKKIWGEKTPEYIDIISQLAAAFPRARFISIIRDGRDVAMSLQQRGWQGWSVYQRATYWKHCVHKMGRLKEVPNACLAIQYEDIVLNTKGTLTEISTFLEIKFEDTVLDFHEDAEQNITEQEIKSGVHTKLSRLPQGSDVYKWKTTLSKRKVWLFESVCYKELALMGYEIAYFRAGNMLHQLGKYLYWLAGLVTALVYNIYHTVFSKKAKQRLREKKLYSNLRVAVRKT